MKQARYYQNASNYQRASKNVYRAFGCHAIHNANSCIFSYDEVGVVGAYGGRQNKENLQASKRTAQNNICVFYAMK